MWRRWSHKKYVVVIFDIFEHFCQSKVSQNIMCFIIFYFLSFCFDVKKYCVRCTITIHFLSIWFNILPKNVLFITHIARNDYDDYGLQRLEAFEFYFIILYVINTFITLKKYCYVNQSLELLAVSLLKLYRLW